MEPLLSVRETLELYAGYYERAARRRRRRSSSSGSREKADARAGKLSGRPAAAPRRRRRADRRPRAALPRRADDRLRPLRPPAGVGGDRRPARPRQDRLPDDPLHGRGAGARRPRRGDLGRRASSPPAPPTTSAAAARRRRVISFDAPAVPPSARRAERDRRGEWSVRERPPSSLQHDRARCATSRSSPAMALERGVELADARGPPSQPRGRLPRADRGRARPVSGLPLVIHQFRFEQKVFWRSPAAVFFTVMFPVIFLIIFSTLFGDDTIEELGDQDDRLLRARDHHPGRRLGEPGQHRDPAHRAARERPAQARPRHAAAALGVRRRPLRQLVRALGA